METIKVGDKVRIYYGDGCGGSEEAIVTHIPQDTGDWWHFKSENKYETGPKVFWLNPQSSELHMVELIARRPE